MKPIAFTRHALQQMAARGVDQREVEQAVRWGEREEARHGRWAFRRNFAYNREWEGKWYDYEAGHAHGGRGTG
jgi:hypothetical protein